MNEPSKKILSTGVLIGMVLLSLLGGLAILIQAMRNADLKVDLELKKDDKRNQKF